MLTTIRDTIERCKQAEPVTYQNGDPMLIGTPDGEMARAYKFDASAVLKGAELLGRHLAMFTDKQAVDLTTIKHISPEPMSDDDWIDKHGLAAATRPATRLN